MLSKSRFQSLLQFTRKKDRVAAGAFFVEGWRWLEESLAMPTPPECVLVTPGVARTDAETALLQRARAVAREFHEVSAEQLARLTENISTAGVVALVHWRPADVAALPALVPSIGPALVVAMDAVGDPGNAGTIVRTADWFGGAAVVFGAGSVEPTNPKTVRATMGSLFHLPVTEAPGLPATLTALQQAGFVTVGAALEGEELPDFRWPGRAVLVLGNEANGIQREVTAVLDQCVRIPSYGRAESLNAAVAAAILMADWRRAQTRATGG